ncbi:LADA_0D08614g1_1 [Lachancea dasiensis]|uniref:Histone acetyltransferase n=1 Tax=Lachancea dasiensis TaxID=1072105 RepID=A0A1G4J6Y0_9SACH|nr:LADA_0D08614g1_1 [Lachancea dasiensis]
MNPTDAHAQRHLRLLRNIELSDNVHSSIANQIAKNPDNFSRQTRAKHAYDELLIPENPALAVALARPESKSGRVSKPVSRIAGNSFEGWSLPDEADLANAINPNVQFPKIDPFRGTYKKNIIKVRYDPKKLLDFDNLITNSTVDPNRYEIDFNVHEPETLFNRIDNDSSRPYRCAIADKKDSSTQSTTPSLKDREFFQALLYNASPAAYYNGNLLLAFSEVEDRELTQIKRFKTKREASKIEYIHFRDFEIKTWYIAPYSEEFNKNKILYICEYCLKYMNSRYVYYRHQLKCSRRHPPGNEIYRDGKISIWEVDGRENVNYCQSLCLLAKLFLNSKTLYYDVEPFIFYILTEREDLNGECQFHFVGYFSKEKLTSTDYNLSCILTLPIYQRKGYGHLLVDFSYLLTKREYKWGTPEKPLSDLGLLSYRNYWKLKLCQVLHSLKEIITEAEEKGFVFQCCIEDLSNLTGMIPTDIIFGLEQLNILHHYTQEGNTKYALKIGDWSLIEKTVKAAGLKNWYTLKPKNLVWKPMIFGPSCGINAMGTMIETTGAQRTTNSIQKDGVDSFNNSLSVLVNFLQDDIADPRSIEEACLQKIKGQQGLNLSSTILANLKLSYERINNDIPLPLNGKNEMPNQHATTVHKNSKDVPTCQSNDIMAAELVDPALQDNEEQQLLENDEDADGTFFDANDDEEIKYSSASDGNSDEVGRLNNLDDTISDSNQMLKRSKRGRFIKRAIESDDDAEEKTYTGRRLRSVNHA